MPAKATPKQTALGCLLYVGLVIWIMAVCSGRATKDTEPPPSPRGYESDASLAEVIDAAKVGVLNQLPNPDAASFPLFGVDVKRMPGGSRFVVVGTVKISGQPTSYEADVRYIGGEYSVVSCRIGI